MGRKGSGIKEEKKREKMFVVILARRSLILKRKTILIYMYFPFNNSYK